MVIPYIKYGAFGILTLSVLCAAAWVVWQNRASEQIVYSFLTVVLLGAAISLVTTLLSVKRDSVEIVFRKVYVFDKISKQQPYDWKKPFLQYFFGRDIAMDSTFLISKAVENDPTLTEIGDKEGDGYLLDKGKELYKKVLFYEIADILFKTCNWKATVRRYEGPGWGSYSYGPPENKEGLKAIKWEEIKKIAPDNELLNLEMIPHRDFYIPKNSTISGNHNELIINNNFVTIKISFRTATGAMGASAVGVLLGFDRFEHMKYWSQQYEVQLKAKYKPFKTGHPDMKDYHEWVNHMFSELQRYFDSTKLWEKTKEAFIFYQYLPNKPDDESWEEAKEDDQKYREWFEKMRREEKEREAKAKKKLVDDKPEQK